MNTKNTISIFLVGIMISSIIVLPQIDKNLQVEASTTCKLIYKANGGKFSAKEHAKKKTVIKKVGKGKKRGTSPKIKRKGYTFKGWFTKKSKGKKIKYKKR